MSCSLRNICPDVGLSNPAKQWSSVDFPEPDGPINETSSPLLIFKFIPFNYFIFIIFENNFLWTRSDPAI